MVVVIALLALLCFMPVATRIIERKEFFNLARITAYIGYMWMASIFMFFVLSLFLELISIVTNLFLPIKANIRFYFSLIATFLLIIYGFYEAQNVVVERLIIKTPKLPRDVKSLKILQISDLHLGLIVRGKRVENILEMIKKLNPDIIVATGDIIDGQANDIMRHLEIFVGLTPPLGKYAVTGNHEYYAGLKQSINFIEASGFRLLRGDVVCVGNILNIAGVDDGELEKKQKILTTIDNGLFTIFLKHRPLINKKSLNFFDIQLSGHTHKGQIFPFYYITRFAFPLNTGLYELRQDSYKKINSSEILAKFPLLYTSRGTGTWGPPIRIFARPEITLIELRQN